MMYCSYNGITLNPKMKLQHYADKIGKSLRTIQRYFKELKENLFISKDNKILFVPTIEENNKIVEIVNSDCENVLIAEIATKEKSIYKEGSQNKKDSKKAVIYILLPYIDILSQQYKDNIFLDYDYRWRIANNTNKMAVP